MAQDLAALICSRICHDIISPIGAIANGLELLEMSGPSLGPEMELISQSSSAAADTVQVMRLAFGPSRIEDPMAMPELHDCLAAQNRIGHAQTTLDPGPDISRAMGQLMMLSVLCLEASLKPNGQITLRSAGNGLYADGTASGLRQDAEARLAMITDTSLTASDASCVQFPILRQRAENLGLIATVSCTDTQISLHVT